MEILQNNLDLIILILFTTVGLGISIYNIIIIKKGEQTYSWFEVPGQITRSEIGISQNPTKETFHNHYRADIEYQYEVAGNRFYSVQAYFGDKIYLPNKEKAERILKMFPINQTVSVFVNPDNNTESVLIRGSGVKSVVNIVVGLILIVIGVFINMNFELILNVLNGLEK